MNLFNDLTPAERAVIYLKVYRGMTFSMIAAKYDVYPAKIQQFHRKAQRKILLKLKEIIEKDEQSLIGPLKDWDLL